MKNRRADGIPVIEAVSAGSPEDSQSILLPLVVLYGSTIAAQLISLAFGRSNQELSFASMVLPSVLFLSAVTLPLSWIGLALGRRIGLGAPLISALLRRQPESIGKLRNDTVVACVLGVTLGAMLLGLRVITEPYLPPELPAFGHRGAIGGLAVSFGAAVAEEVWFRLGLMTLLLWGVGRLLGDRETRSAAAWFVIVVTAVGFGMAHLPQLMSYDAGSAFAIGGTIVGNCLVGILYGWCYWRRSLIAAMVAHFSVDVVLHVLPALIN